MKKLVHLGKGLALPAHALATNVVAALGMRGSGKSNLMTVAAEGLLAAGVQVVVLDYVGIWFGLRLLPNGKPSSFQIPVLGGHHGDITLVPAAGQQVAEALATSHSSAVLDISLFRKADRIKFAADFGEAFFHAKKQHEGPVFLILEEAQRFVPQLIRFSDPGLSRCLGAYEEIAEVGRNYGIGLGLISQRPQKINKDVLNLAELVFAFQTNGVLERKAIAEWVQEKDAQGRDEVAGELPSLPMGTALVWSPSTFKLYGKYLFDKKTTYDAGATPERARAAVKVRPLDLASLESAMVKVVEEAKVNDPRALRARVAELEKKLLDLASKQPKPAPALKPAPAAAPLISSADVSRMKTLTTKLIGCEKDFDASVARLQAGEEKFGAAVAAASLKLMKSQEAALASVSTLSQVAAAMHAAASSMKQLGSSGLVAPPAPPPLPLPPPRNPTKAAEPKKTATSFSPAWDRVPVPTNGESKPLTKCARALLSVIVQRGVATSSQVSALSGYRKTSSSLDTGLSELRVKGLIVGSGKRLTPTEAGMELIGKPEPLPSGRGLLDYWVGQLTKSEGKLLQVVYEAKTIDRQSLSDESGYPMTSSSFDTALSGLRVLELIHGPRGGDIHIADIFNEGSPLL